MTPILSFPLPTRQRVTDLKGYYTVSWTLTQGLHAIAAGGWFDPKKAYDFVGSIKEDLLRAQNIFMSAQNGA